jgi:hypothetical protein
MIFRHVMVKIVATRAGLATKAAGIDEAAREVNILHVLAQVAAVIPNLAAQGAPVGFWTTLGNFLDKSVQSLSIF